MTITDTILTLTDKQTLHAKKLVYGDLRQHNATAAENKLTANLAKKLLRLCERKRNKLSMTATQHQNIFDIAGGTIFEDGRKFRALRTVLKPLL
jgi:hypothetical protein